MSSKRPKWFGPTFTARYQPEEWNNMRLREIKHCRLAMVGFFFMVLTNASTGGIRQRAEHLRRASVASLFGFLAKMKGLQGSKRIVHRTSTLFGLEYRLKS